MSEQSESNQPAGSTLPMWGARRDETGCIELLWPKWDMEAKTMIQKSFFLSPHDAKKVVREIMAALENAEVIGARRPLD